MTMEIKQIEQKLDFDTMVPVITTSIIWYNASTIPTDYNKAIVCMTENCKLMTFKNTLAFYGGDIKTAHSGYMSLKDKYKIKWWTYQDEIIKKLEREYHVES